MQAHTPKPAHTLRPESSYSQGDYMVAAIQHKGWIAYEVYFLGRLTIFGDTSLALPRTGSAAKTIFDSFCK